jgi:hypothetical protein
MPEHKRAAHSRSAKATALWPPPCAAPCGMEGIYAPHACHSPGRRASRSMPCGSALRHKCAVQPTHHATRTVHEAVRMRRACGSRPCRRRPCRAHDAANRIQSATCNKQHAKSAITTLGNMLQTHAACPARPSNTVRPARATSPRNMHHNTNSCGGHITGRVTTGHAAEGTPNAQRARCAAYTPQTHPAACNSG